MAQRTCSVDSCERAHAARGMCSSHYGTWHRQANGRKALSYSITCDHCGQPHEASHPTARFCSLQCKGDHYRTSCDLPSNHPVRALMAQAVADSISERDRRRSAAKVEAMLRWRTPRECPGCGCTFSPLRTPHQLTCSRRCARRVTRWRRRASEVNATGSFTWSEFMRVAQRFGFSCAYCGNKPAGLLDPDHVVPLSRGGSNSTTNLLPSCRPCNSDKRDLLLGEWSGDRERRGLPPRMTHWASEDRRFWHLTDVLLAA